MTPEFKQRSLLAALILIAWAAIVYSESSVPAPIVPKLEAIIVQLQILLGMVVGFHMGDSKSASSLAQFAPMPAAPAAPPAVAGFARVSVMAFIAVAIGLALMLAGCAAPMNAAVSGLMTQEASNVKGTDDNLGKATVWAFCHMPLDWHQRHPEYQQARDTLCGPMASSDASKIDIAQLGKLFDAMRAAGVLIPAAPAQGAK